MEAHSRYECLPENHISQQVKHYTPLPIEETYSMTEIFVEKTVKPLEPFSFVTTPIDKQHIVLKPK
jgi:hypothetical protein